MTERSILADEKFSVDLAMKDAFRKMRHFLMTTRGLSEDEAIDGNWGVHAVIRKHIFAAA